MADRVREDVTSGYLDIQEFVGQSLLGPRELISRRVICSNVQTIATTGQAGGVEPATQANLSNQLSQLNFRLLSTSPGAQLNAKVTLVLPMLVHHITGAVNNARGDFNNYGPAQAGVQGPTNTAFAAQFAPRRNGILKACRSITSTINSTVSFSVRPDEGLSVMEQIFDQTGMQTGVYNDPEAGSWGNTDGFCRLERLVGNYGNPGGNGDVVDPNRSATQHTVTAGFPRGDLARVRGIFHPAETNNCMPMVNKGFQARRADLRAAVVAYQVTIQDLRAA